MACALTPLSRRSVQPSVVFSGDDHDQCSIVHRVGDASQQVVMEQTVGTFSWLQGNLWPSFAVVQLRPATAARQASLRTHVCFLPPQMLVYNWYIVATLGTLLSLVLLARAPAQHSETLLALVVRHRTCRWRWLVVHAAVAARLLLCLVAALLAAWFCIFAH